MKKYLGLLLGLMILIFSVSTILAQQPNTNEKNKSEKVESKKDASKAEDEGFRKLLRQKFVEGDPVFMSVILICLILGLSIAIERIITLFLSQVNTKKLVDEVDQEIANGNLEEAENICANTRGPVAAVIGRSVSRVKEGPEAVEKSIISSGSVEMGKLESGMSWLSLFISLAPLLGFMGTVYGMIMSFDKIASQGDIEIGKIAFGIKTALITTIAGLVVAVILQIFYNICVSKIDNLVNQMEEASSDFVDKLVRRK